MEGSRDGAAIPRVRLRAGGLAHLGGAGVWPLSALGHHPAGAFGVDVGPCSSVFLMLFDGFRWLLMVFYMVLHGFRWILDRFR